MRVLGAQSLRMICELELGVLGPACAQNAVRSVSCSSFFVVAELWVIVLDAVTGLC